MVTVITLTEVIKTEETIATNHFYTNFPILPSLPLLIFLILNVDTLLFKHCHLTTWKQMTKVIFVLQKKSSFWSKLNIRYWNDYQPTSTVTDQRLPTKSPEKTWTMPLFLTYPCTHLHTWFRRWNSKKSRNTVLDP